MGIVLGALPAVAEIMRFAIQFPIVDLIAPGGGVYSRLFQRCRQDV